MAGCCLYFLSASAFAQYDEPMRRHRATSKTKSDTRKKRPPEDHIVSCPAHGVPPRKTGPPPLYNLEPLVVLTTDQAARFLRLSPDRLKTLVHKGIGPARIEVSFIYLPPWVKNLPMVSPLTVISG